jgi:Flp pilus assembly protein TadD
MHLSREFRTHLLVCGALALGTLVVYAPTLGYPFVYYDDHVYVYENPQVQPGLTLDGAYWALTTFHGGNWHPLTWLSLQLDAALYGGLNAGGFHLTNVLLHTANTLLLFVVLSRMTGAVWRSAVVAGLFALHPLHVESVAWVAERKDVLSALFWMLTLAAYLGYVRRPGVGRYLLVLLALALGLMAKPMLVTLPCVLLLLDYWPLGRWESAVSSGRLVLEKLPLFALVLAACIVTCLAQSEGGAMVELQAVPLEARLENALLAYVAYLGQTAWPLHLAVHYPHPGLAVPAEQALGAALFLAVVTALLLVAGRPWPYLAVGWLWYLGTLVPVLGLVQVGDQAMADRYTYVPLIGIFLLLTWGAGDLALAWRVPRAGLVAATTLVLLACAALTWVQVGSWASTLDLWQQAAAVSENSDRAHINLGSCFQKAGRLAEAQEEFAKAVALKPRHVLAHHNLGLVLAARGRHAEAVEHLQKAVALDPQNASAHNDLGYVLQQVGRFEEARAEYRHSIALDAGQALSHYNLASVDMRLGQVDEALAQVREAIALNPGNALFYRSLGKVLQALGRHEEAVSAFRKAQELGDQDAGKLLQAAER